MKFFILFTITAIIGVNAVPLDDINQKWETFKLQHDKVYKTKSEENLRKEAFKVNYKNVIEHNALYEQGLTTFKLQINKFADLTNTEFKKKKNGYKHTNIRENKEMEILPFVPKENVEIPDEFDWREKGAVTPIKDQGVCGSGWTFSVAGALEGQYYIRWGKKMYISAQNLLDCSLKDGNSGCDGGHMIPAYKYIFDNNGIDTEQSYPYEGRNRNCRFVLKGNATTFKNIRTIEKANEEHLKAAIATIGPVSVAIFVANYDFHLYESGVYYHEGCVDGFDDYTDLDQAALAVGYGTENGQDYWLIKNSWGAKWGENGYIKMSRNRNNNCGVATECNVPILYYAQNDPGSNNTYISNQA